MGLSAFLCLVVFVVHTGLPAVTSSAAVAFKDIQKEHLKKQAQHQKHGPRVRYGYIQGSGNMIFGNGNVNGNCFGNCRDNKNGNINGNKNKGVGNGNYNGNCNGNCVGNENGNHNGNYNKYSVNNGNHNGNCFGNCYHNRMGNNNGNANYRVNNNGNHIANCRGNCFHFRHGNNIGNGNNGYSTRLPVYHRYSLPRRTSCFGNCFPKNQPMNGHLPPQRYENISSSRLSCQSKDGYTYYIRPGSYCLEIHRHGSWKYSPLTRTQCAKGEAFDIDICGCNHWWFVNVYQNCSNTAKQV